jgi:hypothetical protein
MSEVAPQPSNPVGGHDSQLRAQVLLSNKKSMGTALLLTLFFGPFGMIYSTIIGAIVMFVVGVPLVLATLGFAVFILWPIQLAWTYVAVKQANSAIDKQVLGPDTPLRGQGANTNKASQGHLSADGDKQVLNNFQVQKIEDGVWQVQHLDGRPHESFPTNYPNLGSAKNAARKAGL